MIVLEAGDRVGGSCRTEALTLPGFAHDVCSAIHPMAVVSPAFQRFELDQFGLQWISPPALLAHPFDDGPAGSLERSMPSTAASLGEDGRAWMKLLAPFVERQVAPRSMDRYLEQSGFLAQKKDEPVHTGDALHSPEPDGRRRDATRHVVTERSSYTRAAMSDVARLMPAIAIGAALALAVRSKSSTN